MSGAISGGAYTAGVLDFLIEALDEWDKALAADDEGALPDHLVGLKVMAGASAGAIAAAIGALALIDGDNQPGVYVDSAGQKSRYRLKRLYDAWVVGPALVAQKAGDEDFLSLSDGAPPNPDPGFWFAGAPGASAASDGGVVSLLNTTVLDQIAARAVAPPTTVVARPYVAENLHIYMTTTNLRGVPYKVLFQGGDYFMISHADRAHYRIAGAGGWTGADAVSPFGESDASLSLTAVQFPSPAARGAWKDFSVCALASGAFPVGLSARVIGVESVAAYAGRLFPSETLSHCATQAQLDFPAQLSGRFVYAAVDGGTIDNDPFEYARFALKPAQTPVGDAAAALATSRDLAQFTRAVIMISAFPERKPIRAEGEPSRLIDKIVAALFPSLIDQARFKPEALILAAEESCASRYLIGPSRVVKDAAGQDEDQKFALASGLLGGFGGFVARKFRDHDFQLGRRNCQKFLQSSFAFDPDHPIVKSWSAPGRAFRPGAFVIPGAPSFFPVIPCCGSARNEVKLLDWPRITTAEFDQLQSRIAARFDNVAPRLIAQFLPKIVASALPLVRDKALDYAKYALLSDLVRRDQIEGWAMPRIANIPARDLRLVIAALLDPGVELRNAEAVFNAIAPFCPGFPDKNAVETTLIQLKTVDGPCRVWEAPWPDRVQNRLFALASRGPNPVKSWLTQNLGWFKPSKVDPPGC